MGVEPVRLRGRDDGGSAVEAALLMAAMTLVLVPILYALGRTTSSAIDSPCDALKQVTREDCKQISSGSGGVNGAIARAESSRTSERWVQQEWSKNNPAPERVECPPLENSPGSDETIDCTVVEPDGTETQVKVTVTDAGAYSFAR